MSKPLKLAFTVFFVLSACATKPPIDGSSVSDPTYREDLVSAIQSAQTSFRSCFERSHTISAENTGAAKIFLSFVITPSGRVTKPEVAETNLHNSKIESCLIEELKLVDFPSNKVPVTVKYPFTYHF